MRNIENANNGNRRDPFLYLSARDLSQGVGDVGTRTGNPIAMLLALNIGMTAYLIGDIKEEMQRYVQTWITRTIR